MKVNFNDWFDVSNIEHLIAYRTLMRTGFWPENFIPDYVIMEVNWNIILAFKLSEKYISEKLEDYE